MKTPLPLLPSNLTVAGSHRMPSNITAACDALLRGPSTRTVRRCDMLAGQPPTDAWPWRTAEWNDTRVTKHCQAWCRCRGRGWHTGALGVYAIAVSSSRSLLCAPGSVTPQVSRNPEMLHSNYQMLKIKISAAKTYIQARCGSNKR